MDIRFVTVDGDAASTTTHRADELGSLLTRADGFVWVDIPEIDDAACSVLTRDFGLHPLALRTCEQRNHLPTVHGYDEHLFFLLFAPLEGEGGHVHLLELDFIVGTNYLVTVHGPLNPLVARDDALRQTRDVVDRIASGRFHPHDPIEAAYAICAGIARKQRQLIGEVAEKLPALEAEVMSSQLREPEELLERMFVIRHELITARTMASQAHDIFARMLMLERFVTDRSRPYVRDLGDQFERVRSMADGESQFLFGVIELFQTKVHTKMVVASERLAVIAGVTLPITAIASVMGMNQIVNDHTRTGEVIVIVSVMAAMSLALLAWARRQGWW